MNKKVKNATCCEVDGIQFKSKLEAYCYKQLMLNGFCHAKYESVSFELLPAFVFNGKKYRKMTYKPDFTIDNNIIIECKGRRTDAYQVRIKVFLHILSVKYPDYKFYEVHNHKEIDSMIESLKAFYIN